jgi:hypothetical protein
LDYSVQYLPNDESVRLHVCNPTLTNVDDGTTFFNLLEIDAQ